VIGCSMLAATVAAAVAVAECQRVNGQCLPIMCCLLACSRLRSANEIILYPLAACVSQCARRLLCCSCCCSCTAR
jgi:hypothetical protein